MLNCTNVIDVTARERVSLNKNVPHEISGDIQYAFKASR